MANRTAAVLQQARSTLQKNRTELQQQLVSMIGHWQRSGTFKAEGCPARHAELRVGSDSAQRYWLR